MNLSYSRAGVQVSIDANLSKRVDCVMNITQQKGLTTELHCILDFVSLGYRCLTPIDDSSKYDVVIDINGKFLRIQCKTATWAKDTV